MNMNQDKMTRQQLLDDPRWRVAVLAALADPDDDDVRYHVDHKERLVQDFIDSQGNVLRAIWVEEKFEWIGEDEMNLDWDS